VSVDPGAATDRTVSRVEDGKTDADTASAVEAAGHFRICLGAAAGVGKTYAMLSEGRRRKERGTDVVIGFIDSHGRRHAEEMTDGLEVVPRKVVQYRGSRLAEPRPGLAAGFWHPAGSPGVIGGRLRLWRPGRRW
jgi:Osmosensitive K+ channel His kinase sensor domain